MERPESEKRAAASWGQACAAADADLVFGAVDDEPKGYYVSRRARLRLGDDGAITLWLDAFAHDWTIGHRLSPIDARNLARLLERAAKDAEGRRAEPPL